MPASTSRATKNEQLKRAAIHGVRLTLVVRARTQVATAALVEAALYQGISFFCPSKMEGDGVLSLRDARSCLTSQKFDDVRLFLGLPMACKRPSGRVVALLAPVSQRASDANSALVPAFVAYGLLQRASAFCVRAVGLFVSPESGARLTTLGLFGAAAI